MSLDVTFNQMYPFICEQLSSGGQVRFKPKGTSMLPTLRQGTDEVVLTAFNGSLKKYDIAFYRRQSGQFVLHRVVKKPCKNTYVMRGDHQFEYEYGITDENIIGVAKGFYRNGKFIKRGSLLFLFFATVMPFYYRLRVRIRKIQNYFWR